MKREDDDDDILTTLEWPGEADTVGAYSVGGADDVPDAADDDVAADDAAGVVDADGSPQPDADEVETGEHGAVAEPPLDASPRTPLLPALAYRVDAIGETLASLAMRVDTLGAATATLRTVLSDRLVDYAETMATVGRTQSDAIEEHRHAQERTIAEVRRSITMRDEALRKVSGRVEELLTDTHAITAQVSDLIAASATIRADLRELHQVTPGDAPTIDVTDVVVDLKASMRELTDELNSSMRGLVGELDASLRGFTGELNAPALGLTEDLKASMRDLREELNAPVRDLIERVASAEPLHPEPSSGLEVEIVDELRLVREEVQQVKRRIGVRGRPSVSLEGEQLDAMTDVVRDTLSAAMLDESHFDRIAEAVVKRLEAALEIVPADEEPPAAPKAPPRTPSSKQAPAAPKAPPRTTSSKQAPAAPKAPPRKTSSKQAPARAAGQKRTRGTQ